MRISGAGIGHSAYHYHKLHNNKMASSLEKLSSGFAINRAADNASGMAISQKMRAQIKLLSAYDEGLSMSIAKAEIDDGMLSGVHDILNRLTELATRAMSDSMDQDRYALNEEYQQLVSEIDRMDQSMRDQAPKTTKLFDFGGNETAMSATDAEALVITGKNFNAFMDALDEHLRETALNTKPDELSSDKMMQAAADFARGQGDMLLTSDKGATETSFTITVRGNAIYVQHAPISISELGLEGTDLLSSENATAALDATKAATNKVSLYRADIGAAQNRMEASRNNLNQLMQNLMDSLSHIEDTDMAQEMMNYVKEQLLTQTSSLAMLHTRMQTENVLSMLIPSIPG